MAINVLIRNAAGDVGSQIALGVEGSDRPVPPVLKRRRKVSKHTMSRGASSAGRRVTQDFGTHLSWSDVEINCQVLDQAQMTGLETLFDGEPPAQVRLSWDAGTTWYLCTWAEDGLEGISRWDNFQDKYRGPLRYHVNSLVV